MKTLIATMLLIFLPASVAFSDNVLLKNLHPNKKYVIEQKNGKWVFSVVDAVVIAGNSDVPSGNDDKPINTSTLMGKVQSWTAKINADPTTTKALVEANLRILIKGVKKGDIKFSDVFVGDKLFKQTYDKVLEHFDDVKQWEPFRKNLAQHLITLTQDKKLDTKEEVLGVLEEIVNGHKAFLDSSGFLDRIDKKKVWDVVKIVAKLFANKYPFLGDLIEILEEF